MLNVMKPLFEAAIRETLEETGHHVEVDHSTRYLYLYSTDVS